MLRRGVWSFRQNGFISGVCSPAACFAATDQEINPSTETHTVDQTHYRCESQARLKPRLLSCPAGYHSQASHSFHVPHSNLANPLGKTETILANFLLT